MPSVIAPPPSASSSTVALAAEMTAGEGLAVYVHWPFCLAKCPYCDFNSHVRDSVDQARWATALCREIDHYAARTPGRTVTSVFFGGGTPSLMDVATVAAVLDRIAARWPLAADTEITLEANPTSAEAGRFAGFIAAGVNRISLGVQALDDAALVALGRRHDVAEALAAVELARRLAPRLSFDLIYARPGQSVAAWRDELRRALALAADHLALYQLTIEPETAFYGLWRKGDLALPDEDTAAGLYETTQELCDAVGLAAYEVSNHALRGGESRHNLTYWRYGDYIGIGAGAHGRLVVDGQRLATRGWRKPEGWLAAVESVGHGAEEIEVVAPVAAAQEMLLMGLRLQEGVARDAFRRRTGLLLDDVIAPPRLARLIAGGFVLDDGERLRVTTAGRAVLNTLLAELLA